MEKSLNMCLWKLRGLHRVQSVGECTLLASFDIVACQVQGPSTPTDVQRSTFISQAEHIMKMKKQTLSHYGICLAAVGLRNASPPVCHFNFCIALHDVYRVSITNYSQSWQKFRSTHSSSRKSRFDPHLGGKRKIATPLSFRFLDVNAYTTLSQSLRETRSLSHLDFCNSWTLLIFHELGLRTIDIKCIVALVIVTTLATSLTHTVLSDLVFFAAMSNLG